MVLVLWAQLLGGQDVECAGESCRILNAFASEEVLQIVQELGFLALFPAAEHLTTQPSLGPII